MQIAIPYKSPMTGKILIVDDAKANRMILHALLERDYYTVFEAEDGIEAIEIAREKSPDLILLDYMMPRLNGLETCKRLKANPQTMNTPVVMVTSSDRIEEKNATLAAGADDFLTKPINQEVLFARIRNLLRVKTLMDELHLRGETASEYGLPQFRMEDFEKVEQKLLLIASTLQTGEEWKSALQPLGNFHIQICAKEEAALQMAETQNFDALVVAENLSDGGVGMRLIANLRAHWKNRDLTILFLAQSGTNAGLRALELGSNDYMLEPFDPTELATRLRTQSRRIWLAKSLREQFNKQLRLSVIDPLTELHNRRYLDDYMPKLLNRAKRDQTKIALMILDLDHFKSINDDYGHDFGDAVLVEFARRARESLRAADLIVRFGGEEFVIITPGVTSEQARNISERLRKLVAGTPFETATGEFAKVTTSVGVTMIEPGEDDLKAILKRADEALYLSKEKGRNQVNFAA